MATIVQTKRTTGSNSATLTACGAGNTVFICIAGCVGSGSTAQQSVTGVTLGGVAATKQVAHDDVASGSATCSEIWKIDTGAGGQTAVVVTGTNLTAVNTQTVCYEVSGGWVLDKSNIGPTKLGNTTWTSNATATTTVAAEFWLGVTSHGPNAGGSDTLTQTTGGWTNQTQFNTAFSASRIAQQSVVATAAATYSGTSAQSDWFTACVATFKPAPQSFSGADSENVAFAASVVGSPRRVAKTQLEEINAAMVGSNECVPQARGLALPCVSAYSVAQTGAIFNLTTSSVDCKVIAVPPVGTGTTEAFFELFYDASNYFMMGYSGGVFFCRRRQAAVNTAVTAPAFNKYWRIREAAGTVYFATSPDRSTWSEQSGVHTLGTKIQTMRVHFECGYYGTESSPGPFIIEGVNVT